MIATDDGRVDLRLNQQAALLPADLVQVLLAGTHGVDARGVHLRYAA